MFLDPRPAPVGDRPLAFRLGVVWLVVAVAIAACGLWASSGRLAERGDLEEVILFGERPSHGIVDVWVRWDAASPGWAVLEAGHRWSPAVEAFWRRRLHPGWNHLVWDEVGTLPEGASLSLRRSADPGARWAVGTPRVAERHGIVHLGAFRGVVATLALTTVLSVWLLVGGGIRAMRRLGAWRRGDVASADDPPAARVALWARVALLGLGAGALALRLHTLATQSLWFDEVLTAIGAQSFTWVLYSPQVFGHPPLQYLAGWLAGVAMEGAIHGQLLGAGALTLNDAWLRAPFVGAGVGTVLALGWLGCRLLGARTGVIAALVLAISPFHVELSQTARPYAFLLLFTVLSLLALVVALRGSGAPAWLWFTVLAALAFYTHYLAVQVIVLEALLAALLIARRRGGGLLPALASFVGLAVLLAPWVPVLRRVGSNLTGAAVPGQDLASLVINVLVPQYLGPPPAHLLALALLAWALWSLRQRRALVIVLALWLLLPPAALWLAKPTHFIAGRHLAFVLPVALLVMASGVASAGTSLSEFAVARLRRGRPLVARGVFAVVALAVVMAWATPTVGALRGYYWWRGGADWRTVASVLESLIPKGDRVIATAGAAYPLRYYWDERVEEMDPGRLLGGSDGPRGRSLWIVTHEGWDRPAELASWLERNAIRVGEIPASWSLPGVRVYRMTPRLAARPAARAS
jgi:hypothetical protein